MGRVGGEWKKRGERKEKMYGVDGLAAVNAGVGLRDAVCV